MTHSCTITSLAVDRAHAHGTTQEAEPDETPTAAAKARPRITPPRDITQKSALYLGSEKNTQVKHR